MAEGKGRIGLPELSVGVTFTALLFSTVAQRVRDADLRDLVFSARTVLAEEAVAVGLADERCPADQLLDRALEAASRLGAISAEAFAVTKLAFAGQVLGRAAQLAQMDARSTQAWTAPGTYEAIRTYLDKTVGRK
jgi:enoyl-CoA hydratase